MPKKTAERDLNQWPTAEQFDALNLPPDLAGASKAVVSAAGLAGFLCSLAGDEAKFLETAPKCQLRLFDRMGAARLAFERSPVKAEILTAFESLKGGDSPKYMGVSGCAHSVALRFVVTVARAACARGSEMNGNQWPAIRRRLLALPPIDGERITAQMEREAVKAAAIREAAKSAGATVASKRRKISVEEKAMGILGKHPDWSNQRIASRGGFHVKDLTIKRTPRFFAARKMIAERGRAEMDVAGSKASKERGGGVDDAWIRGKR
jgi:hypothetical protein